MMPKGLVFEQDPITKVSKEATRGVLPSVVKNAVDFGTKAIGSMPGTIEHTYENVKVITNEALNKVITVWTTGY